MIEKRTARLLWVFLALLVMLVVSWRFVLPKKAPDAVAPAGASPRMQDPP